MSYTPTVWANGDTVTPAKLNKIEQGISDGEDFPGSKIIVNADYDSNTDYTILDKTFNEIETAYISGKNVIIVYRDDNLEKTGSGYCSSITAKDAQYDEYYSVEVKFGGSTVQIFACYNRNDYPYGY